MNVKKLRERTGLSQEEFWARIGMSQSGGSRLENENRDLSEPLRILVVLAFGEERESRKLWDHIRK